MGAQKWHIVPLLGDVTSPTTAVHYVSMTSDLCFLSTEKHYRCADSTRCTQTRVYSARGKYIVRHWTSREASLRHSSGWGTWSVSPQYRDLRTRALTLPSLYLRHISFSNPSVASPTSQFIPQPFFHFSYVTSSSLNSPGQQPMLQPQVWLILIIITLPSLSVCGRRWSLALVEVHGILYLR